MSKDILNPAQIGKCDAGYRCVINHLFMMGLRYN